MKNLVFITITALVTFFTVSAYSEPGEIETTVSDQKNLFITIYNQDIALIKDRRILTLPQGETTLAFKDISGRIIPETALVKAEFIGVIEQHFEFDLLTPESLLKKFTGEKVSVVKTHPETGEETFVDARVLSTANGVVLEMNNRIETGIPGRIVYPYIPDNLRKSPTLTMLVESRTGNKQDLELTYLTNGLTWKADYVAQINSSDDALNLSGWVTLTNTSMTAYTNADLQLVAGDVNIVPEPAIRYMKKGIAMAGASMEDSPFFEEQLFEYHLYTLNRKITIKNNQSKQVALLNADSIPCKKEFLMLGESHFYRQPEGQAARKIKIGVYLELKNSKKNNLGIPLPKGVVRVYKQDSKGKLQFAGEDRTDHLSENATMRLKLGNAFDITAEKKQISFQKLPAIGYKYQSEYEIKIRNSKKEAVSVKVMEPIPGDWRITKQTHAHKKESSRYAVWNIQVPAKGMSILSYTVQIR